MFDAAFAKMSPSMSPGILDHGINLEPPTKTEKALVEQEHCAMRRKRISQHELITSTEHR